MDYFKNATLGLIMIAIGLGCMFGMALRGESAVIPYIISSLILMLGFIFFVYSIKKWDELKETEDD